VVLVDDGMALAAGDEPAVERIGDGAGDEQGDGEAPPEAQRIQAGAVPMTMPRTSPMAQPVRQCTVALNATRFRESCAWVVIRRASRIP
jgi:hypothetical protein